MMKTHATKLLTIVVLFLLSSVIISQSGLFSHTRIDLTENKLFTLNQGTKNILKNIDENVHLKLYFSDEATHNIPMLRTYKNTVLDLLNEMQRYAGSKLKVSLIDPKIFSPEEDEASQYGLQALPAGEGGENIFFGLVGENSLDSVETIAFMHPNRETFMEYDIAQLINSLNHPEKKTIALMSSIDLKARYDNTTGQRVDAQIFVTQLQKDYTIRHLEMSTETIDADVDVLMLIHPQNLSEKTLFAIDQFVLKGGRLVAFVDSFAQAQVVIPDPQNPAAAFEVDKSSNLDKLFKAWNIEFDASKVLLDEKYALNIARNQRHLAYLAFESDALNKEDIISRDLDTINVAVSGYFGDNNMQAIIHSSKSATSTTTQAIKYLVDPNSLYKNYTPQDKNHIVAGRVTGIIKTAFPESIAGIDIANIVKENHEPKIVLFADVDMLFDRMWVKSQNFFGRQVFNAFADNGNLVTNLMDNMAGSADLINIRGRKNSARPFTKVQELQKESDKKFRQQENVLKQRLQETEQKLNQLQQQKGQQDRMIMSQQQEQELQKFQAEKLEVRKKLREVRRNLDKDIQELGTNLKIINIGLLPLLISLFGIFILWFKPKRTGGKYAK